MKHMLRAGLGGLLLAAAPLAAQVPDPDSLSRPDPSFGTASAEDPDFKAFDRDGDGMISPNEVEGGAVGFSTMDTDGNGMLSPEEFQTGLSSPASPDNRRLAPAGSVPSTSVAGGDLGMIPAGPDVPSTSVAGGDTGLAPPPPPEQLEQQGQLAEGEAAQPEQQSQLGEGEAAQTGQQGQLAEPGIAQPGQQGQQQAQAGAVQPLPSTQAAEPVQGAQPGQQAGAPSQPMAESAQSPQYQYGQQNQQR